MSSQFRDESKTAGGWNQILTVNRLVGFWVANLIVAGFMGFIPNPMVGPGSVFEANVAHNLFHIASGLVLLVAMAFGSNWAVRFMLSFGPLYAFLGVVGFAVTHHHGDGHLLEVVHINVADNLLHILLGTLIGVSGWIAARRLPATLTVASIR